MHFYDPLTCFFSSHHIYMQSHNCLCCRFFFNLIRNSSPWFSLFAKLTDLLFRQIVNCINIKNVDAKLIPKSRRVRHFALRLRGISKFMIWCWCRFFSQFLWYQLIIFFGSLIILPSIQTPTELLLDLETFWCDAIHRTRKYFIIQFHLSFSKCDVIIILHGIFDSYTFDLVVAFWIPLFRLEYRKHICRVKLFVFRNCFDKSQQEF